MQLQEQSSRRRWPGVIAAIKRSLGIAAVVLFWDVAYEGFYTFSVLICPPWFLISLVKNIIQRPGWAGRRRDWRRRWDDKAEALDPDRWKAMASAWLGMLQDLAGEAKAEQGSPKATKSCPYCAKKSNKRRSSASIAAPGWSRPGGGPI